MKTIAFIFLFGLGLFAGAQEKTEDIVMIVDDLTVKWDEQANRLKTYQGLQDYCATKPYRDRTIELLTTIHHWDTTLYFIVKNKYAESEDEEAAATLKDIERLEAEYTTQNFKAFIHRECNTVNEIERNYGRSGGKEYEKSVKVLEKELLKYVNSITERIDIIDEHIHHLKLD